MRFRASNLPLLAVIVAAIAAVVLYTARSQGHAGDEAFNESTANTAVQNAMHKLVSATDGYVATGAPRQLGQYEGAQLAVERAVTNLRDVVDAADEGGLINRLAGLVRRQQTLDARGVHARQATGRPDSPQLRAGRIAAFTQVVDTGNELSRAIDEERRDEQTRAGLISVGAVGVLALLILTLGLAARSADRRRRRMRRFSEGLQAARTEGEAYGLVKAHLERSVADTKVAVFNRNNSADRLEPSTPLESGSTLSRALEGAKPDDCLAIRTAKPSTGGTGSDDLLRCDICGKTGEKSLCVPSIVGGEVIGSVLVQRPKSYGEGVERTVSDSVAEAAPVIAHLRNLAIAERRASSDKLTGLPNKRSAEDSFKHLFANARRSDKPLSLILFDLDHFKRVNDTLGHPKGDEVLASVGSVVHAALRKSDFAARDGGEEFMVLLPGDDAKGARHVAEKLRGAIAEMQVTETPVTASFGVASYPDQASTREELIRKADRALYSAKRAGRNRVHLAGDEDEQQEPSAQRNGAVGTAA